MRNVWKGLVIGGLTGAAAGLALDLGERGARGASALGEAVAHHAPEVADQVLHTVTDAVSAASGRARDSALPAQVRATTAASKERATSALSDGLHRIGEAAAHGGAPVARARDRARDAAGPS